MINLHNYLFTSYRRKLINKDLINSKIYIKGKVLDVGGGKTSVAFTNQKKTKWTTLDINPNLKPDILASVEKMPIRSLSFDVVKASELFEHVSDYDKGVKECIRVLKKGGHMIITCPFLYPLHEDPADYQRITRQRWIEISKKNNLRIIKMVDQGYAMTLFGDFVKAVVTNLKFPPLRYLLYFTFPILDFLVLLDRSDVIKKNQTINKYPCGYYIVFKKL